jgi:hypothetical protein
MTNFCAVVIISTAIFVFFGQTRAAVIPPEWADVRINPCAKVPTNFSFFKYSLRTVISFQIIL